MTTLICNPLFSQFTDLITSMTGLHFGKERSRDLEHALHAAAREFGFDDEESYLDAFLNHPLAAAQIDFLVDHLTIGETYFFRDEKQFEALEQHVLPELIENRRRAGLFHLRVWSAACATGEEPYSIAILLHRLIPDISNWNVTILGTDINRHFLRKAVHGVYRDWSFRAMPGWMRDRYFSQQGKGIFRVAPLIKRSVTFSYLNLAEPSPWSMPTATTAMDVIFCRNMLMYFTPTKSESVVARLWESLAGGGWLFVSASEASQRLFSRFSTVNFPGAILYRKTTKIDLRTYTTSVQPSPIPVFDALELEQPPEPAVKLPGFARQAAKVPATQDARHLARICADEGKLAEAVNWCEKAICADRSDPVLYYLLGTILEESGKIEDAVIAMKRALYLDHDFVLAHFALGNLSRRLGKHKASQKHFENLRGMLRSYKPEELLQESDGMTAGTLLEIVDGELRGK